MTDDYKSRVIRHSLMWVNGYPSHNKIDDECVADFSCCLPEMFTEDLGKRIRSHKILVDKLKERRK